MSEASAGDLQQESLAAGNYVEDEPELTVRQQAARDVREMWNIAFGCDPS